MRREAKVERLANTADYVKAAKMYTYDDGALLVQQVELKISRAALCSYAGVDNIDNIGFRSMMFSHGEYFFANESSIYPACGSNGNKGYHVIDVGSTIAKGYKLTEYGQRHTYVAAANADNTSFVVDGTTYNAPNMDGVISAGEYNWQVKGVNTSNLPAGFKQYSSPANLGDVDFYISHDEENIYLAIEAEDGEKGNSYNHSFNFYVGASEDIGKSIRFYMPRANGGPETFWIEGEGHTGNMTYAAYVTARGHSDSDSSYVKEIAISKASLTEAFGVDLIRRLYVVLEARDPSGSILYAFGSDTVEGYDRIKSDNQMLVYPNVIILDNKPGCTEHVYVARQGAYTNKSPCCP